MNDTSDKQDSAAFRAADISKKKKPDYFAGRVKTKKHPLKDFRKTVFGNKRRLIIICIACTVLLAATIILILWLTLWRSSDEPVDNRPWSEQAQSITRETYDLFYSDSDSAFFDALDFIDTKIAITTDPDRAFDLRMTRAIFLISNGGAQLATAGLLELDESNLSDTQRYEVYLNLRYAYRTLGDESSAQFYNDKINALPKDVTILGD